MLVEKSENKLILDDNFTSLEAGHTTMVIHNYYDGEFGIRLSNSEDDYIYYYSKDKEDIENIILFLLNCL